MNKATLNIFVRVVCVCGLMSSFLVRLLDHLAFIRNYQTVFQYGQAVLYSLLQRVRVPVTPIFLTAFYMIDFFLFCPF